MFTQLCLCYKPDAITLFRDYSDKGFPSNMPLTYTVKQTSMSLRNANTADVPGHCSISDSTPRMNNVIVDLINK